MASCEGEHKKHYCLDRIGLFVLWNKQRYLEQLYLASLYASEIFKRDLRSFLSKPLEGSLGVPRMIK